MKQMYGIVVGVALAACSRNERPPEPSAASVQGATSTPSDADFTPPENRIGDTDATGAPGTGTTLNDGSSERGASTASGTLTPANGTTGSATTGSTSGTNTTGSGTTGSGTDRSANTSSPPAAGAGGSAGTKPDNTAVNKRDRDASALTPTDQGESESDRKITAEIRQAVMRDGSLSFSAKNVKIITINGKVTLRGAVKSAEERAAVERAAARVAGAGGVDNQLEIAK